MNVAIILSGGTGTRLGENVPKQYIVTDGRSMIERAMEPFFLHPQIHAVQIVADRDWHESIREDIRKLTTSNSSSAANVKTPEGYAGLLKGFSLPGRTRALSIFNALQDVRGYTEDQDVVIVHDAARPFVSGILITRLLCACEHHDGALPVLPMKDTMYLLPEGSAFPSPSEEPGTENMSGLSLIDRSRLAAGQAPEAFRFGKYFAANEALLPDKINKINGSTEVALLAGMDIALVAGEEENFKVTTPGDMERYHMKLSLV